MPYKQHRRCPLCESVTLNLSDHFSKFHGLSSQERQPYLQMVSKELTTRGNKRPAPDNEQIMEEKRKLRMISRAKLHYHERKLKEFQTHLKRGTTPKTLRLKSYPKMKTLEGQTLIHEACDEVQKIMLIQMVEEERQALTQAQKTYKSLQEKTWKPKPKEEIIKTLQKELESRRAQLSKRTFETNAPNETTTPSETVEGCPENT